MKSVEYDPISTEPEVNGVDVRAYEVNVFVTQLDCRLDPEDNTVPLVDTPLTS